MRILITHFNWTTTSHPKLLISKFLNKKANTILYVDKLPWQPIHSRGWWYRSAVKTDHLKKIVWTNTAAWAVMILKNVIEVIMRIFDQSFNFLCDEQKQFPRQDIIINITAIYRALSTVVPNNYNFPLLLMSVQWKQAPYTLSHLENDRDVSAYSGGRRLTPRAQLVCFLTRSKRNTGIDA